MEYLLHIAILFGIYGILSLGLNLVFGYAGLLSIAHAGFYGIGAYATAILTTRTSIGFFLSIVIGMLIAGSVSLFIGAVLSRLEENYYALASLGFSAIIYSLFLNWEELTRGPLGIPGIGRPSLFGIPLRGLLGYLVFTLVCLLIVYLVSRWIGQSSFGRVLKAIREDEPVAQLLGYKTFTYKRIIFCIAAMMAAFAGSLFASYVTFIDPSSFSLNESIFLLSMVILGGLANVNGSLLGAAFLILLPEALRFVGFPTDVAAQLRQATYGLLLILCMLYRPQGLKGEYKL